MALTSKLFDISKGIQTAFNSDVPIKGRDFVALYLSTNGLQDSYTRIQASEYSIINDVVVFTTAPSGKFLRLVVATNRGELLNTPTNTATVASNITQINKVAENMDKLYDSAMILKGNGVPDSALGDVGYMYINLDGGLGNTLFVKELINTWTAK